MTIINFIISSIVVLQIAYLARVAFLSKSDTYVVLVSKRSIEAKIERYFNINIIFRLSIMLNGILCLITLVVNLIIVSSIITIIFNFILSIIWVWIILSEYVDYCSLSTYKEKYIDNKHIDEIDRIVIENLFNCILPKQDITFLLKHLN